MDDDLKARILGVLEDRADDARLEFIENWHSKFSMLQKICESPIELLLGAHLLWGSDTYGKTEFRLPWNTSAWPVSGTVVGAQVPVGEYRTDFLFRCCSHEDFRILVVECDGHDFHEKTKQQASRDKRRDRWFLSNGIRVLRYSGSDIWRDPAEVESEISGFLGGLHEEMWEKQGILHGSRKDPL